VQERAEGRTYILFDPVGTMLRAIGVADPMAARLEPAQRLLEAAVLEGKL
jgi:hypothetical protein